jgi:DNA-binding LacI/PurR family transcriptional regulator
VATTLKDVAMRAGVSIKTVSNVIHGNVPVAEEKRHRVIAAIAELQYRPNMPARLLRKNQVGIIALAFPDLCNPYFAEIGDAIVKAAAQQSYTVLLDHTGGKREHERLVAHGGHPHLIDGVILHPLALHVEDLQASQNNVPLVLLGERPFSGLYDQIMIDNVDAARNAIYHLISMGRRRIAVIGARDLIHSETSRQRLHGYIDALIVAGLPFDEQIIMRTTSYQSSEGMRMMRKLLALDERPDAVFCFSDQLALGAMRVLHEEGIRIPEDIAIIGVDHISEGAYTFPSLTTIAPDKQQIGELAVTFLIDRIQGHRTTPAELAIVPFQLIVRESTAGRQAST